jgi:hypothetical protein
LDWQALSSTKVHSSKILMNDIIFILIKFS